ncbi:ABC transporter substrate-binding protein [Jatrophihabitans sp. GAS493]|uniref:ABC transporter substrate-binding protein n=1 Tax=Jatrophihabitans sp. GAS493 TaxID=1907575 RepID=UPI0012FE57B7|nr:ABC transporter substrate-binding protein [Jatrophihabitans sp. GAS493]
MTALLVVSGCSSSSTSSSGSNAASTGSLAAGKVATGSTITIGAQAPMNGAAAFPQTGYGVEAAEYYINNVLGGINGHKLKVDLCAGDGSPETSVNCANGFVSKNYPVVLDAYDTSMGGEKPILMAAKIPVVGTLAGSGLMDTTPYPLGFYLTGPTAVSAVGSMTIIKKLGKTNASLAIVDAPATHTYVNSLINPIAKNLGLNVQVQYLDETSVNYTVAAAAQLKSKPEVGGIIALSEDGCTKLFTALRAQGFQGTIFAGSCSQFVAKMGESAAGSVSQPRLWIPSSRSYAPPAIQAQLDAFAASMKATGHPGEQSARSLYSFAGLVTLAQVMDGITGDITASAVSTAMSQVKDLQMFAGGKITCDGKQWPGAPTACSHQAIYFVVQKDGTLKPGEPDGYFDLDTSVLPST